MVRAAALASGDGARLQAILDAVYFNEIPNFSLEAVICPQRGCYAMTRSLNAGVPAYVVDPELFPNITSHSIAVANKLKDMDIELVILAGYDLPLGVVPYQFKNRVIGTYPALYQPASIRTKEASFSVLSAAWGKRNRLCGSAAFSLAARVSASGVCSLNTYHFCFRFICRRIRGRN